MRLRLTALLVVAGLSLAAGTVASAAERPARVTKVDASCAGDLISGRASVTGRAMVSLRLLSRRNPSAKFLQTGKQAWIRSSKAGSYKYRFDISKLSANAYRVRTKSGTQSAVVRASACAPGYQVPEAPLPLLLPLSLLLMLGLAVGIRRYRQSPPTAGA
jgi:hypothetical protein